jgi:uncharacterized protein
MTDTVVPGGDDAEATYTRRLIDGELDELFDGLPAIAVEGPRAVGKTATALQRAKTVYRLDDGGVLAVVRADPGRLVRGDMPILIDEWQRFPESFDRVRRAVDDGAAANSFLLTGSATPKDPPTHSGAGRIVRVRLRPMTLAERGISRPTISLRRLLSGSRGPVAGSTQTGLDDYVHEILRSGLPALLPLRGRVLRARLDGYLDGIVDHDFEELGQTVRRPQLLRSWMAAYAAATSTVASYAKIRDAAEGSSGSPPSRSTAHAYQDALERLFLLDPVPAWLPTTNRLARLASPPKHHLADPAFAARLLDVGAPTLLAGKPGNPGLRQEGTLLGALFESLVTQSVRVYAQVAEARVSHLRTHRGDHEIDLIVERDGGVLAIEVKLTQVPSERDVQHLRWLEGQLGDQILDSVIITTGPEAYRRADGIAVIPAALLGP